MTISIEGACGCGAVTFTVREAPQSSINCHCGLCRRLSGNAFTTWVSFSTEAFDLSGQERLRSFAATLNVTRHFCSSCGTHVFTADARYPKIVGVPAGVIFGELELQPKGHYFVSHKAAWHAIGDSLPQFGGESGFEPITHNI